MKTSHFIIVSALCLLLINCAPKEQTYTVEMVDGTRVVHNLAPAWGDEQKITLSLVRTLGEVGVEEDENYQFFGPIAVQTDQDENIYILELQGKSIKKYGKNFKYISTIGKDGSGPGEFIFPNHFEIGSDSRIYVFDLGNQRIEVMTLEGNYYESIRIQIGNQSAMRLESGSYVKLAGARQLMAMTEDNLNILLHIYDSAGNATNVFGKTRIYEDINMRISGNDAQLTHDLEDNIFSAMIYQNRIEKYTSFGELLLKISRQLPYEEGYVRRSREDGSRAPIFSRSITLDEKGRIWVQTYAAQMTPEERGKANPFQYTQTMLEVYDETGVLLTRIKTNPSGDYRMSLIHKNRIYFTSSSVNMDVKIYEIIEK